LSDARNRHGASSAERQQHGSDSVALATHLARYRQRFALVSFARAVCIVASVALPAVAVVGVQSGTAAATRVAALLAAVLTSIGAAAAVAFAQRPALGSLARTLDRRLQLDERVSAALEHGRHDEPIVSLIVADAVRRLETATPAAVFPMDIARVAGVATAALAVALVMTTVDISRRETTPVTGEGAASSTGPNAAAASSSEERRSTSAPRRAAGTPTTAEPTIAAPTASDDASLKQPGTEADRTRDSGESSAAASSTQNTASTTSVRAQTPETGSRGTASNETAVGSDAAIADRSGRDPRQAADVFGAARGARGSGGAGRADEAAKSNAGGVGGGLLGAGAATSLLPASALQPWQTPARLRLLRAQADAAMSRDDIPPDLRKYVRDYFLALQGTSRP
jgi:hypothetical protein